MACELWLRTGGGYLSAPAHLPERRAHQEDHEQRRERDGRGKRDGKGSQRRRDTAGLGGQPERERDTWKEQIWASEEQKVVYFLS